MADTYGIVLSTIQILYPLIRDEVNLLFSVKSEAQGIKDELESILGLLKNVEERAEENETVKVWVKQVREFAYEIEDVIDEYKLFQKADALGKMKQLPNVHKIANVIKSLHKKAVEIGRRKESYSNRAQKGHSFNYNQQPSTTFSVSVTQDSELVGAEVGREGLLDLLRLQDLEEDSGYCRMIAVIGKQGLGKTTIVGSVYNDVNVRNYFPIQAWIPVPRPYNPVHILRTMINQFYEAANEYNRLHNALSPIDGDYNQIDSMDEVYLQHLIRNFLKEKRYMVVMDDVRDEASDTKLATYIKSVLPINNSKGSKIIMTTRYENVGRDWVGGSIHGLYKLKPLTPTKAWELFCNKAFQGHGGSCPRLLHDLAQEILNRCNGEPFLISAMGCFLSTKSYDPQEWEKVHHNLEFYLKQELNLVYNVLIHNSYHILPHELKPCFLYFGLFPKDYAVSRMKLIRLWIAEGFIGGNLGPSNLTLEQVAEDYMNRLIGMSLIEVKDTDDTGKPKTLRICGILYELVLSKVRELGFCQVVSEENSIVMDGNNESPRRLTIHVRHSYNHADSGRVIADQTTQKLNSIKSNIRTLLLTTVVPRESWMSAELTQELSWMSAVLTQALNLKIRLLKVLDLCDAPIHVVPKEVDQLLNLRYLSLRNTQVKVLPRSIGKLRDLQTLDLKGTEIHELPSKLKELHKLRHLLTYCYKYEVDYSLHVMKMRGAKIQKGSLENFGELQKLAYIDVAEHASAVVKELRNLRQLRRLGITGLKEEDGKHLCDAVENMEFLEAFSVYSKPKTAELDLEHLQSRPPLTLKRLYLNGSLKTFPSWIFQLQCLVKIRLRWSSLQVDPLQILETLPNLVEAQLLEAYTGKTLKIGNKGFKKLKILNLLDLNALEYLHIDKGALPSLQLLTIGEIPKLQVPLGIEYIPRLEKLSLFHMPSHFVSSLQQGGQHYSVVKHVTVLVQNWANTHWETYFI